jgi:hypothetical protein
MEKIPTAEEFLTDKYSCIYEKQCEGFKNLPKSRFLEMHITGRINGTEQNVLEMMIEFAKLHVEAALKEASENVKLIEYGCSDFRVTDEDAPNPYFISGYFGEDSQIKISEDSILNSYPLENIK